MKVLFDHPNPFFLAHGGFQTQIEQTKAELEKTGLEVDWLRWWESETKGDLIHFFGRPHPAYIRMASKKNLPVIFSDLLGGLGSRSAPLRWIQKWLIRGARCALPQEFTIRMGWESYQLASRVIALTAWEKRLMEEQFSAPNRKVVVIPNGVEEVFFGPHSDGLRDPHLITTMTITERKRSVELVDAVRLAQIKIRIFGAPYHPDDPYHKKFLSAVKRAGPLVDYAGGVTDREKIANEYRRASGFVLLSSMESQSLSALEAAACGCPLLLSDLPWAKASFGAEASYAPVASAVRTAPYLQEFFHHISSAPRVRQVLGWNEVAGRLAEVYREAMTSR